MFLNYKTGQKCRLRKRPITYIATHHTKKVVIIVRYALQYLTFSLNFFSQNFQLPAQNIR